MSGQRNDVEETTNDYIRRHCNDGTMKTSGKIEVLATTPIAVARPLDGGIIAKPYAQASITPYVVVVEVQPLKERHEHIRR